jgi:hypothetical protein
MRGHRITRTGSAAPSARHAAAACLAIAALLGPAAAAARTRPHRPPPAASGQAQGQLGLELRSTGAVVARIAFTMPADAAHRCAIPDSPGPAYLLSFGGAPDVALLDPARPGLIITLARQPSATVAARDTGASGPATGTAAADRTEMHDSAQDDSAVAPEAEPPHDTIQLSIGGRRFVGIGSMDPQYRLAVTLSADGQRGRFTARHLVDASGGGVVDVSGTWRCPAPVTSPAGGPPSAAVLAVANPASHDSDIHDAPGSAIAPPETSPANAATGAATSGVASALPPSTQDPAPDDPATPDAARGGRLAASTNPAAPGAAPESVVTPGPATDFLGQATATLAEQPRRGRGRSRRARKQRPGCTSTATLDGVSAALQAAPFGRSQGLAIMQFRNVVTDGADDSQVDCHSDVVLSDDSLHHAEYGLRSAGRRTRLHIRVARDREDEAGGQPSAPPRPAEPAPPEQRAPDPVPPVPAT